MLIWLAVHTCWQTTAMRTFSTRSPEISKRVFSWAGFIYLGRGMMPMMWGIAALAMLGPSQNSLEAMPRMLATILPSGVLGLVVAGMLAATMSVNSSYLLGWSAIIAQDIIGPLRKKPLTSLAAGDAKSRRQSFREPVRDGVGLVVHAAGTNLFLSQHDGYDLSVGNTGGGGCRTVLESSFYAGWIPGDGGRRDRDHWLLFLQDSSQLRRSGSVRTGGDRYDRGLAGERAARLRRRRFREHLCTCDRYLGSLLLLAMLLCRALWAQDTPVYFDADPGLARLGSGPEGFWLSNAALRLSVKVSGSRVTGLEFENLLARTGSLAAMLPFTLLLGDGSVLPASALRMLGEPKVVEVDPQPDASRLAERIAGGRPSLN